MEINVNLDIFGGIGKIIDRIIKTINTWWILRQLREVRNERIKHKVINEYVDDPLIDSYIEELDKEEADLRSQL